MIEKELEIFRIFNFVIEIKTGKNDAKIIKEELKKNDTIKEFYDLEKKWKSSSNTLIESDIVNKIASLEDILSRTETEKTKIFEMIFNYKRWEFERNVEQLEESFFGKVTIKSTKKAEAVITQKEQSPRPQPNQTQKTMYDNMSLNAQSFQDMGSKINMNGQKDWYTWF